ncbi:hypothetical protein F383_28547 [Gossypium arboreum]|uniref:Uncharacterized protein n=1 Tax=Gossypium arboreum TaxID=29729 RepID=A0A0B0PJ43_GOSAR|nr:hypothetical protein F383_28547 [Gossypium arboreum]
MATSGCDGPKGAI